MKKFLIAAILSMALFSSFAQTMPVIKIYSKSKNNDFVTKPVSEVVTKMRKTWGDIRNDPAPWNEECTITVFNEKNQKTHDSVSAKVKVRGNWTTSYDKKPLRIRFTEKQPLLGMNNGQKNKDWLLLSEHKDWSYMRDPTALSFAKLISPLYASDTKLAEVYINDEYWGVYVVAELQEVCNDRVNITEPAKKYKGTDIGYLMEFDAYYIYEEKNVFTIDYCGPVKDFNGKVAQDLNPGYTIKSKITNKSQNKFISSYMNNLWKICYEAVYNNNFLEFDANNSKLVKSNATNIYDCVSKVVDIDSLIDAYIIAEVTCDPDIYHSSFYLSLDMGPEGSKKLRFEAPWDFDSTMGNKRHCIDGKGLYAGVLAYDYNFVEQKYANPWLIIFTSQDWFQKAVKAKWRKISSQKCLAKLNANIDFVSKNYSKAFEQDQERWNHIGNSEDVKNELNEISYSCKTQRQAADYLKGWLTKRFAYLDSIWLK